MSVDVIVSVIKFIAIYLMPIAAVIISLSALKKSKESVEVKVQLNDIEKKLQAYELELKEYEIQKLKEKNKKEAEIDARIVKIADHRHRVKIWNSGNATAYNVDFSVPEEYNIIVHKDKTPFEYLEAGKGFEETVVIHMGSEHKCKILCTWQDENGNLKSKTVLSGI